jgi:LuxR family maltose regulon positive regulatory protein
MASETEILPLIRTKLYRPRTTGDLVPRTRLLERLEERRGRPLTLVVAPAGYGKTTLVSSWLEACDRPNAWLSLDEGDNDLSLFLSYFAAAIQTLFPDAVDQTSALLNAASLPQPDVLARSLINELDQIEGPFFLVLDDYHLIQNMAVHDLLTELFRYPPRALHLVLASRSDPPLSLTTLRARSQVTEIRAPELRFTRMETVAFLEQQMGMPTDDGAVSALMEQLEGWVTGLRLLTLSLRHRGSTNLTLDNSRGSISYAMDYLGAEVLENQPRAIRDCLLRTAILDRFCAPLCEAVCSDSIQARASSSEEDLDGVAFLEWVETANLFVTRLDDQHEWYRYHPLFQELLQDQLKKTLDAGGVAALHRRASTWYAENGNLEEALGHALTAGDTSTAVNLVVQHRHEPMNQERGQHLERWLNLLPKEAVEEEPQLLLAGAWVLNNRFKFGEMVPLVERAAAMLEGDDTALTAKERKVLGGEIAALRCIPLTWMGQGQPALETARHTVDVTPIEHEWVRGIGLTFHPVALHLVGRLDKAYEEMHKILAEGSELANAFKHRAYVSLITVEVLAGNLSGAEQAARQLLDLGEARRLYDSLGWAKYSLGFVHYQRNDLAQAKHHFEQLVEMRYLANAGAAAQAHYGLALTYQVMGKPDQARETHQSALAWASETGDGGMLIEADSLGSRLALLQGQVPDASRWASMLGDSVLLMLLLHIPHLTLANVLLARGTPEALIEAKGLLAWLRQAAESTHNTWRLMETAAMQAVLKETEGKREEALALLEPALVWAKPHGFVRLFVDLGPKMAGLLDELRRQGVAPEYLTQILAAFATKDPSTALRAGERRATKGAESSFATSTLAHGASSPLVDPLTNRELEVLELMAQRLTNKEIAAQLVISVGTVKQHAYHIYQKLHVKGRRQAVAKAISLGILSPKKHPEIMLHLGSAHT